MSFCAGVLQGVFRSGRPLERQTLEVEREKIRKSAITQSRSVLGGKFTEQIAPYLPDFKYDPTEARFIGTPFDLIIFPGLAMRRPAGDCHYGDKDGQELPAFAGGEEDPPAHRGRHGALRAIPAAVREA